jgi:hypothetical protein
MRGKIRPGRESALSPQSSAEFDNNEIINSTPPPYAFIVYCLITHRNKFTLLACKERTYGDLKNNIFYSSRYLVLSAPYT